LRDPISIQQDESVRVRAVVFGAPPVLLYRVLNDIETVTASANAYVEMKVEPSFFAEAAQPRCERSFAIAFGTNKDTSSLRD